MIEFTEFIGLFVVALGALFGGLGYYLKERAQRLKNIKTALYFLLEIRHVASREFACEETIGDDYLKYCLDFFKGKGLDIEEGMPEQIENLIRGHISSIIAESKQRLDQEFLKSFNSALSDLSRDYPVISYKIRGSESLTNYIILQKSYIDEVKKSGLFANPILADVLPGQMNQLQSDSNASLVKDINNLISSVSIRCGILEWWECKKIIAKPVSGSIDFKDQGLDDNLESYFSAVVEAANKHLNQDAAKDAAPIS
tara:strand:+ start:29 stop:796 length:768 start_codon:yes stop_codon:yes gene_type:complete